MLFLQYALFRFVGSWAWCEGPGTSTQELASASGCLLGIALSCDPRSLTDLRDFLIFILFIYLWTPSFLWLDQKL